MTTNNNINKMNNKGNKKSQQRRSYDYSNHEFKRGEVFMANMGHHNAIGSEQSGYRPIVILHINKNEDNTTLVGACLTTKDKGRTDLYFHIEVDAHGVAERSFVCCEHIRTVTISQLREKLYELSELEMAKVNKAMRILLNAENNFNLGKEKSFDNAEYKRGSIYNINITDLRPDYDNKWEPVPCVILQNNIQNRKSPTLIVAKINPKGNGDISKPCGITFDFITTIDKQKVDEYIRPAIDIEMKVVEKSMKKTLEI